MAERMDAGPVVGWSQAESVFMDRLIGALMICPVLVAASPVAVAQEGAVQAAPVVRGEDVPPALGDPAMVALDQARAEIAGAGALLARIDRPGSGAVLDEALRRVIDARGSLEQAIASAKAAGAVPDTASDGLDRAIDSLNEVARGLRQLDPPINALNAQALGAHLDEAMVHLQDVTGQFAAGTD